MRTVIYTEISVWEFCCESLLAASSTDCAKRESPRPHPTLVPPTTTQWPPVPYRDGAQCAFSDDP